MVRKSELVLEAQQQGEVGRALLPEEAVLIEVALRNDTAARQTVRMLDGSLDTPVVLTYDSKGGPLGQYEPGSQLERTLGDLGGFEFPPPQQVTLEPGEAEIWYARLWGYTEPFPQGSYTLHVAHDLGNRQTLVSNRVAFRIVNARVLDWALGYDSSSRMTSTLVWIGVPIDGSGPPRLLVRMSGFAGHDALRDGATPYAVASEQARLAVGQVPFGGMETPLQWIAVYSGDRAELIRHNMTYPVWRSELIPLGVADAVPVPRFPDRGYAVPLATGTGQDGRAALAGAVVQEGAAGPSPWLVPLSATPRLSACAFAASGTISLLFVMEDGETTRLNRLDVAENGQVATAERTARTTANRVLAVTADQRPGVQPGFLVLEADRQRHDHVALVRLPLDGEPQAPELALLPGWPMVADAPPQRGWPLKLEHGMRYVLSLLRGGKVGLQDVPRLPLQAIEAFIEVDAGGTAWLAFSDEWGNLYAAPLDGQRLGRLRSGSRESRAFHPHIVSLHRGGVTISSFTEQGTLFHGRGQ